MKSLIKSYWTDKQFTCLLEDVSDFIADFDGNGLLSIYTKHTTCAIKILENEILLLADINKMLERLFPKCGDYLHDVIELRDVPEDERINGFSHMRQFFLPTSETIPVIGGQLQLGEWQTPFLVDLDTVRERQVVFSLLSH